VGCDCRWSTTRAVTIAWRRSADLDGILDIYMPDFKFWNPETAYELAKWADCPNVARDTV
jgi:uncharacterized Fe-S radical SAM superfamily protein PflX